MDKNNLDKNELIKQYSFIINNLIINIIRPYMIFKKI